MIESNQGFVGDTIKKCNPISHNLAIYTALLFLWHAFPDATVEATSTYQTGANCTGCGDYWPWSPSCRWGSPTVIKSGSYRESRGNVGSSACHPAETSLPFVSTVEMASSVERTYSLESGEWTWFGLTASVSNSTSTTVSISVPNSCNTSGCCLTPMKAFMRWSYSQCALKRQIAKSYLTIPGTSQYSYFDFEDCVACNSNTRKLGVLHSFPSPDLRFAWEVVTLPYAPPLQSLSNYCAAP